MSIKKLETFIFIMIIFTACPKNVFVAGYYRLLKEERKIDLGLRSIDSISAAKYLNLPSPTERKYFYDQYWHGRNEDREEFERRAEYALKEFGKYAPLTDERIPIYMKYGNPTRRYIITPEKKVGIVSKEYVRPAEIWTYKSAGIEFDFIRLTRAFMIVAKSEFGEKVKIPYLKEDTIMQSVSDIIPAGKLNFDITYSRFRQQKNLVRLEIYTALAIEDTINCRILRRVQIYNRLDSLVMEKNNLLQPVDGDKGFFYDETNLWLVPQKYRVVIQYFNSKTGYEGKNEFYVDLLDYRDDAKKISDLVFAKLIDDAWIEEKFFKPVGRVMPFVSAKMPMANPFYIYHEIYNLKTQDGQHLLKVDYEIYNKERMRKEIVDIMSQTESGEGNIAYIAAKYHPMDLRSGEYIIVARSTDLLSGEQYTAISEFILEKKK